MRFIQRQNSRLFRKTGNIITLTVLRDKILVEHKHEPEIADDIGRIFDGSPVSLGTVAGVVLLLLIIDVVLTFFFATVFSGRSRQDYSLPRVGEYLGDMYNRYSVYNKCRMYLINAY